MIKEDIKNLIQKACKDLQFPAAEISLERTENSSFGDYSTNIALVLARLPDGQAKQLSKNPREVAEKIILEIRKNQSSKIYDREILNFIEKIEVAGPGFINFFLSKEYFLEELKKILKEQTLRLSRQDGFAQGKKVIIEFTDPNPFKEFHIGHLYSNCIGEAIAKLFEASGAKVKRANYQGDVGMHVAKALWGMQQKMEEGSISFKELQKRSLAERIEFLGQSYAKGAAAFEESGIAPPIGGQAKKEITELNAKVFALVGGKVSDTALKNLYQKGRKWSLEYFETMYKRLGTKFDTYYFESNTAKIGEEVVAKGFEKGIFEKSEGAIIFKGETRGLHSRVFINSQGLPTYEAKELGLALLKYKDFKFDLSLTITGNEVNDYFKVLFYVIDLLYPEIGKKMRHIGHGMVRLPEGKMSSRTGNVVTGEELLNTVKARAFQIMESAHIGKTLSEKEKDKVAEEVALAAVKYSFLKVGIGKDIIFDFEKSLSLQGDSGPYLQYTFVRCTSILQKAKKSNLKSPLKSTIGDFSGEMAKEELALLRLFPRFSEVVGEAAEKFSPSILCGFAFELAQAYNLFYNMHKVLEAETKEKKEFRLMLTAATAKVLKNSLFLLGIATPEKM